MAKVYVLTVSNGWNDDYKRVFSTIDKLAEAISEDFREEFIFMDAKDIKKYIKEREKTQAVYLFFANDIDSSIEDDSLCGSYSVMQCVLE